MNGYICLSFQQVTIFHVDCIRNISSCRSLENLSFGVFESHLIGNISSCRSRFIFDCQKRNVFNNFCLHTFIRFKMLLIKILICPPLAVIKTIYVAGTTSKSYSSFHLFEVLPILAVFKRFWKFSTNIAIST